jgi:hypothetical protein
LVFTHITTSDAAYANITEHLTQAILKFHTESDSTVTVI